MAFRKRSVDYMDIYLSADIAGSLVVKGRLRKGLLFLREWRVRAITGGGEGLLQRLLFCEKRYLLK